MADKKDLTKGNIASTLIKLSLPIMGTSFVQMAYSLTDMLWVGRLGTDAVAAVGTVGFFTWLANAFIILPRIGTEVGVSQSIGQGDDGKVKSYVKNNLQLTIFLAILYSSILIVFRKSLIGFFNLDDTKIVSDAIGYLVIVALGFVFFFLNPIFTAIFNGAGDSKTPFRINSVGLILNVILDPLLIFGIGPFPKLGVAGAAIATVIAQIAGTLLFLIRAKKNKLLFKGIKLFSRPDFAYIGRIIKLGLPSAIQSGIFTTIAIIIARIIASWGSTPIAVQKVGSQIEAISWLSAGGFQTAMAAFVGQNFGAKKEERVRKGYFVGLMIVSVIGIFASLLLFFGAEFLFSIFISEEEAIIQGISYLRILAFSQFFMAIEIMSAGAFYGVGKPMPPAIIGIVFNLLRIPAALILSSTSLGLNGIWWAISISSIFKGLVLTSWYLVFLRKKLSIAIN